MGALLFTNLESFKASLANFVAAQKKIAGEVGRGLSAEAFNHILTVTAQFSGDAAGNWKYAINTINTDFNEVNLRDILFDKAFIMGDSPAVNYAKAENFLEDSAFVVGDTAYISNSAHHDDFYAWKIEEGSISFREGNEGGPVRNTVSFVGAEYGGVLTDAQISKLRATRVGWSE